MYERDTLRNLSDIEQRRANSSTNSAGGTTTADGPRRLNVAVTRAKRFCALIGCWTTLCKQTEEDKCAPPYNDLRAHLDDTGRLREVDPELIPLKSATD